MKLPIKLIFLSITPVAIALILTYAFISSESKRLSEETLSTLTTFLMDSKRRELINYSAIANSSVKHLYGPSSSDNEAAKNLVASIFEEIKYNNEDGYFFVYDEHGVNIAHPKQPFRVGKNWWDIEDPDGVKTIQVLINKAKNGGGFYQYSWDKPSKHKSSEKMSYSWYLGKWNWMVGTGVYLDDIEKQLDTLQGDINTHIQNTEKIIIRVALTTVSIIFLFGLILAIRDKKQSTTQLNLLNQRIINLQEEERKRVSHEIHDGIVQILVSVKYSLEASKIFLTKKHLEVPKSFGQASEYLNTAIQEIRRISHDLHPRILDELGLGQALDSLTNNFNERTGIQVELTRPAVKKVIPDDIATTLYRVAQESLTNIERHSQASSCQITLNLTPYYVNLTISDNGKGFDSEATSITQGIGIWNLTERLEYQGGELKITSSHSGTEIKASISRSAFNNYS